MKLAKIIKELENPKHSVLVEKMIPYKKALLTYYQNQFGCDPVLMVTSVTNSTQYARIVPSNEFEDCVREYLKETDIAPEDYQFSEELIAIQSIMLKDL